MYSKYERRTDTRTYEDRKKLMREAGRSSGQKLWMPSGRRSTKSGPRGPQRSFPSGSVSVLAKRLDLLRPLRERRKVVRMPLLVKKRKKKKKRKITRKRRKRKRRSNFKHQSTSDLLNIPDAE